MRRFILSVLALSLFAAVTGPNPCYPRVKLSDK